MPNSFRLVGAFVGLSGLVAGGALAQERYPLSLKALEDLKPYGIALVLDPSDRFSTVHFPGRCYAYGDRGWDISVSNALAGYHRGRGFSLRSACMALVSGIRFNPETGKRLATYVLANPSAPADAAPQGDAAQPKNGNSQGDHTQEPIQVKQSMELPLSVPTCFRRALPYTDCAWNYDPLTGQKLAAEDTRKFRDLGARIEQFLRDGATRRKFHYVKNASAFTKGMILLDGSLIVDKGIVGRDSAATFYDYGREFPKGYGYALYADGAAADAPPFSIKSAEPELPASFRNQPMLANGPHVSPELVKALSDEDKARQIDPKKLKEVWGTGT